jgi:serine/threonine protein kinase
VLSFSVSKSSSWFKDRWPWGQTPLQEGVIIERQSGAQSETEGTGARSEESGRELEAAQELQKTERSSWNFEAGAQITKGRSVLKRLAGGSRYEVYLTWDDRLFAITVTKILRPDLAADEHALGELRREVEVLERLAHPCLVRSFDAVLDGTHPHIMLEHLEGPTLRHLIKRQRTLSVEQLLPLALHVAAVLQYMAGERVVHLDVKPSNIVMGMPPRLLDLSIARSFERAARLRDAIGTDAYMPPEQCDPNAWPGLIGPAADVWGLGATLFHAATGETPFPRGIAGSTDRDLRYPQLIEELRPFPKHVPRPLQDLIASMLAYDPDERPAVSDVAEALEPYGVSVI